MNYISKIIVVFVFFMFFMANLFSSCSHDEELVDSIDDFSFINANISASNTNAMNDPLILGQNEYFIRSIRLFAFDGDRLDNMAYKENISSDALTNIIMEMKVKQTAAKTLYAIINEPIRMSGRLGVINHPDAFGQIEYEMADYFTTQAMGWNHNFDIKEMGLPMFGKLENINTITPNAAVAIKIDFPVRRSLARVDVMVQKKADLTTSLLFDSQSSISIINTRDKGMIAPSANLPLGELTYKSNAALGQTTVLAVPVEDSYDRTKAVRAFTFYTPEHDCSTPDTKMKFKLQNLLWGNDRKAFDVTINKGAGGSELMAFERGKIYQIYCTFIQKESDLSFTIESWINDSYSFDTPTDITFSASRSKIELDYAMQGNSFSTALYLTAKVNGDQPHNKPDQLDDNIYFDGYEYRGVKSVTGSNLPAWFNKPDFSRFPLKGEAMVELSYQLSDEVNKEPVYLWFRAGNIKKRIQVIYDNGFLPNALLRQATTRPWLTNQPNNGVQLTKRGNLTPTVKAKEEEFKMQFSTDNTIEITTIAHSIEHGRGQYNTDAINYALYLHDSVAMRCKKMGEGWYLPSAYELSCINSMNNYLGASYLIRKGYSNIWSSSGVRNDNRMMWVSCSQPMPAGDYLDYANKNESNILRCIRNH